MKVVFFGLLLLPALSLGAVKLPESYTTTGRIILPYADIVEPFNVSISGKANKGVYNFYNGKV